MAKKMAKGTKKSNPKPTTKTTRPDVGNCPDSDFHCPTALGVGS
jgi:hypothetical protein